MVDGLTACPDDGDAQHPPQPTEVLWSRLEAAADAMGSVVQKQAHKPWSWSAMDAQTRPIVAFDVGDRSYTRGKALRAPLPRISRAQATCHIDRYAVSKGVIPAE